MARKSVLSTCLLICMAISAATQDRAGFSLTVDPAVTIPFPGTASALSFTPGFQASINADYVFPAAPFLLVGGSVDYGYTPGASWTLNSVGLSAGPGLLLKLLPSLSVTLYGRVGYLLGMLGTKTAPNPYIRAGLDVGLYLGPSFHLSVGGEYVHQFAATQAQYQGIAARLTAGFNFSQMNPRPRVEIREITIDPVFPVFYKYYDENRIGTALIRNGEDGPVKNIKVSFFVKQYMDAPKELTAIPELKKGQEAEVPLYALFNRSILSVLEPTKAQAEIRVIYGYGESIREATRASTATINHRNGMTWDDDRRVASFATVNDPAVLAMAKGAAGIARGSGFSSFDVPFRQAMGVFEELGLYGVRYVPDPSIPYSSSSKDTSTVDYLQFPIQTLQYKSGDCDDLSILYAAMLEAGAVETAFITGPGHIYLAFALGMKPEQAAAFFSHPEDLIMKEGKAWVPVEITLVQDGFLRAWQIGAREWRDDSAMEQSGFYPTHDAWKLYEPVAILGTEQSVGMPNADDLTRRYSAAMQAFIDRDIGPRVQAISAEASSAKGDPRPLNRLGVLYARYEQYGKAEQSFRASLLVKGSAAAYANLGNVLLTKKDFAGALKAYQGALSLAPNEKVALAGLVRSTYELDDRDAAARWLDRLAQVDKAAADKLTYAKTGDSASTRAGEAGQEGLSWTE